MSMAKPEALNTHLVVQIAIDSPGGSVERTVNFQGERARQIYFLLSALLDQINQPSSLGKGANDGS